MEIRSAARTHVGRRKNNEDSLCLEPEMGLFVVADGMGGYEGGEVASGIVVKTVRELFWRNARDRKATWPYALDRRLSFVENMVSVALRHANSQVIRRKKGRLASMGSTAVVLVVREAIIVIGHVGDSRLYRLRDGQLQQLTRDHSLVAELERHGVADVRTEHLTHVITRAIGIEDELEPEVRTMCSRSGDVYLLCSDGLSDPLEDREIAGILSSHPPEEACRALVERALVAGGSDNVTTLVVSVP